MSADDAFPQVTKAEYDKTVQWLRRFQKASDRLDPSPWISQYFANDAIVNFASQAHLKGHEEIISHFEAQMTFLQSMQHIIQGADIVKLSNTSGAEFGSYDTDFDWRINQPAQICYTVADDPAKEIIKVQGFAVLSGAGILGSDTMRVKRFDVFGDFSSLQQKIVAVGEGKTGADKP